ncbi:MAG: 1-deoxy-D-xylulose-5-phosphate synthase [Gammaproteobacteria bacterium]|nr:1-deoxy-D-xylulose-5-phosphate synthase [Gammaproteobacteria bacterium]
MRSPVTHTLLAGIDDPAQLRQLPAGALEQVAEELREFLLQSVAASGGHLASGLGTVELTIALHYCYDTPQDAIVWDVGHQCYPHKALTGRRDSLGSIRKRPGISGFLKRDESRHDSFGAGHSSTSISAALGMACAARQQGRQSRAVAVIGDGALTAGLAFEALGHAGGIGADLLVVLNDNGMSISENVGALSQHLTTQGRGSTDAAGFFATLGFAYHGPVDGHDMDALVARLQALRDLPGPRLLHVVTRKGKGYPAAEAEPIKYHGVAPFDPTVGIVAGKPAATTYTQVFGETVCELAAEDPRIAVVTPAMREGSGLVAYARRFPDRYHDVGIAEQHAVTFAAGLATQGMRPVVAIYSTFLQRGYDQLVHDVCLQQLPVTFAIDRAGLVGPDGATHNGSLDNSFLRCVPGLVVMTPASGSELRAMLRTAVDVGRPCAVRYPRTAAVGLTAAGQPLPRALPIGRGELVRHGSGIALLAFGTLLEAAHDVADIIDASVANMRYVKPLDEALLLELAERHEVLVTLEESAVAGGAGSAVSEFLAAQGIATPVLHLGLPDRPIEHGTREQCLQEAGLDVPGIFDAVARYCARLTERRSRAGKPLRLRDNAMFNGVLRLLTRSQLG